MDHPVSFSADFESRPSNQKQATDLFGSLEFQAIFLKTKLFRKELRYVVKSLDCVIELENLRSPRESWFSNETNDSLVAISTRTASETGGQLSLFADSATFELSRSTASEETIFGQFHPVQVVETGTEHSPGWYFSPGPNRSFLTGQIPNGGLVSRMETVDKSKDSAIKVKVSAIQMSVPDRHFAELNHKLSSLAKAVVKKHSRKIKRQTQVVFETNIPKDETPLLL